MSMFRKIFYRKPPDKLLEISERVYVFDCCFSNDVLEEVQYKDYIGGVGAQLRSQFPDASFMVFNFREGETQSLISNILTEYDMTVMDYPRHYEGCPLLTMEMIHHFLRSSESWLSLCQQNILLMHCERGGWPVLAFMLAGLLIYRRQYTGEQKTLDMIYKQAPRELMQLLSPLNPLPSQLRYLQYVSRRNVGSEWPPLDRALTLDCVILRIIPKFDGEGGCRPIFRIYGQDPFIATDRTPKVLFSTPKSSKNVRHYKESDCELVNIDIHCHIQGDVVLECISLDEDLEREEMMFRVMFNTAFIRSNILILNRDEIDILWNAKDRFPKDFRAEVLLSEMDAAASLITVDLGGVEEKEGLPVEAFAKVQEIFNSIDWMDLKVDPTLSVIQRIASSNAMQEKLDIINSLVETKKLSASNTVHDKIMLEFNSLLEPLRDQHKENLKSYSEHKSKSGPPFALQQLTSSVKTSPHSEPAKQKARLQDFPVAFQRPAQLNIIAPRIPQPAFSNPVSHCNSLQSSPLPLSRYHSAPSALGITAVLGDHTASHGSKEGTHVVTKSPQSLSAAAELNFGNSMKPISSVPSASPSPSIAPSVGPMIDSSKPPPLTLPEDPKPSPRSPIMSSFEAPLILPQTQDFRPHSALPSRCEYQSVSNIPVPPPPPLEPTPLPSLTTKINFPSTPCPPPPPPPPLSPPTTSLSASSSHSTSKKPPTPPAPPPLHFELASCPASKASIPPPPPQPHVSPGPPNAPPPPTSTSGGSSPFSKGVDGASTNLDSKGINGGVRPPPPGILPNFAAKGWGLSRSKTEPTLKKTSLKPLHWVKVTRAMQGSLWAESHKHGEISKAAEFDMKELESLFSAVVPKSDQGKNEKSSRRSSVGGLGAKSRKIHLIDLSRAKNCEIMLTKVKMPFPDLMNSLLALDDTVLDADQVDNLIRFCPTKEEIELLKGFTGEKENLGRCEQFFLELMKVPRVESKLRVFSFKIQFHSQVSDLRNSLNIVNSVSEEIRKSAKLKRIMQTILSLGNALNQGTARGSAIGFRLDSLLKLTDTRARNHKMTLMHYLCKVLAEKLPEVLDFHCDLVSLEAAAKIQLKTLAEEMQAISKGLEKVEQELTASENDGSISQNFTKTLKEFLVVAEAEVRSLTSLYSWVGRSADALAIYFGEDPSRCQIEQVVSTLLNFVKMFCRDHDDNCKQLEREKKKAQKEAENEKMKINTHRKDSEHLTHSPVRSGRTT